MYRTILLDIDGTLIDSNDAHAQAWVDVLALYGMEVEFARIRALIGMGSDHLLPKVTNISPDSDVGKQIIQKRGEIFRKQYLPSLKAFPGARELIEKMKQHQLQLIVATSASEEDLSGLLKQAQLSDLLQQKTNADDAENSKPSPDIILAALKKSRFPKEQALMIGDTPYDIAAAAKAGVKTLAFGCGGWSKERLQGAIAFYDGPWHLYNEYDNSPLAVPKGVSAENPA